MKFTALFIAAALVATAAPNKQTTEKLKFLGTRSMSGAAKAGGSSIGNEIQQGPEQETAFLKNVTGTVSPARVPADHVATPAGLSVQAASGVTGYAGLTHAEQRLAGGLNQQFSTEPPDQCLAVGGNYILEGVNSAFRVRLKADGSAVTDPMTMNGFFGLAPSIIRTATPPIYGPFTSDPKCYYDSAVQRWFITILQIDTDPATGNLATHSSVLIAVSTTNNPAGNFNIFQIDTTNNTGTPDHAGCPCFGDQPLIGTDASGFYITTNEFSIAGPQFNGAQVYAMSKAKLMTNSTPAVIHFSGIPLAEDLAYSLQPAMVPPGGSFASANNGTEYFLSALDFTSTLDNRIAIWALTNTSSLDNKTPSLSLQSAVLNSQVYGMPPAAQQMDGPLPLGDAIAAGLLGVKTGKQHTPLIESNDDRMQQTIFAAGKLWSTLDTVVKTDNGPAIAGGAWFTVEPTWNQGTLGGNISGQGYISVNGKSILFPAVGVNKNGSAIVGFTIVAQDLYPSAAYVSLSSTGAGAVNVVAQGAGPDDGFTGYPIVTGTNAGRWGDYSAASADENGDIWFATEFIPNAPRTVLANWGTFITKVPQ